MYPFTLCTNVGKNNLLEVFLHSIDNSYIITLCGLPTCFMSRWWGTKGLMAVLYTVLCAKQTTAYKRAVQPTQL